MHFSKISGNPAVSTFISYTNLTIKLCKKKFKIKKTEKTTRRKSRSWRRKSTSWRAGRDRNRGLPTWATSSTTAALWRHTWEDRLEGTSVGAGGAASPPPRSPRSIVTSLWWRQIARRRVTMMSRSWWAGASWEKRSDTWRRNCREKKKFVSLYCSIVKNIV